MKMISWYILLGVLVFNSCSPETIPDRFERLFADYDLEGSHAVNYEISSQDFIEEVDSNLPSSLCYEPQAAFLKLTIKNEPIEFQVLKHCFPYMRKIGRIEILRMSVDSLRIDFDYIDVDSLEGEIMGKLNSKFSKSNFISIQPSFGWSLSGNKNILSDMDRTFNAIRSYSDEVCTEWYGNKLDDLKDEDFQDFQKRFRIEPAIDDLTPDPPNKK
jgi:hypothetical protein